MGRGAFPQYSLGERVADGTIHVISVAASVAALTALLIISIQTNTAPMVAGFAIYGVALVATFYYSAGYRLIGWPRLKEVFRRLDHTAIFLMIAATYTPFVLIKMDNAWGHGLLAVVWIIAAIGIAIKLLLPRFLDGLSTALYLVQGWLVLAAWGPLQSALTATVLTLVMVGGVLYTVGSSSICRISSPTRTPSGMASCCRRQAAISRR